MKRLVTTLSVLALLAVAGSAFAANQVRISQVYGGGGTSTGTYLYDYVEIFNSGTSSVNISGWTIEYGSATGNWGSSPTNIFTFPTGAVIEPCRYVLVQLGSAGSSGTALPVAADYVTTNISAGQTNGKFGLFSQINSNLACGLEIPGTLVDKVAYGTANCAEGTAAAALSSTTFLVRGLDGMTDTDNNSVDFAVVSSPTLHNRASAPNPACLVTPSRGSTWGQVKTLYR